MSTNENIDVPEGLDGRREEEPIVLCADQDVEEANEIDTAAYENPEFFTPKEISLLLMSQSLQFIDLISHTGDISVDTIRRSADLAALNITLALHDASMARFFENAKLASGSDTNMLIKARQRLGTAIGGPGEEA